MLKGTQISKLIGSRSILCGVDIELLPGKVTAILGPNGAGKTTLLRILSGEWLPSSGSVELNGRPLQEIPVRQLGRLRAYLHQESSLDFAFKVLEVVMLGRSPHMQRGERPADYAAARRALAEVDLQDRVNDLYTSLSGGEKQRVHLARVLAQMDEPAIEEPRSLFLDEPTNNLDLSHQQMVYRVARTVAGSNVAVCMVIHDLNQAFQVADVIHILDKGQVALSGSPGEIAGSHKCDEIFGVALQRIHIPGRPYPYLVFEANS